MNRTQELVQPAWAKATSPGKRQSTPRLMTAVLSGILATVLGLALSQSALSATTGPVNIDPASVYGNKIYYTIRRNGKKIGRHTVEFKHQGGQLNVSVASSLTVTILKIPVYRFRYTSVEFWRDGQLQKVTASTTEKGKTSTVSMHRDGDSMVLQNPAGDVTREVVEFSSNHWNPGVLSADRLFNTLTAKANQITISNLGNETLSIKGQPVDATHYRYTGELRVDVWYDQKSRWVKLAFKGSDGSAIEYLSDGFTDKS